MNIVKGLFSIVFVVALLFSSAFLQMGTDNTNLIEVDCSAGDTLAAALEQAVPGDTIQVSGTCDESITITTDGLTLEGTEDAVIDAGGEDQIVVAIDGARDLLLRNLTIQNGSGGVLATRGALFTMENVTVQNNESHGIELIRSTADLSNITSSRNGRVGLIISRNSLIGLTNSTFQENLSGLVVFNNSTARLFETNDMSQNETQGVTVGIGGAIFTIGSTLLANNNGQEGIFFLQGGNAQVIGGRWEANENGAEGIHITQNSTIIFGIEEFGVPGEVLANNNAGDGVRIVSGANLIAASLMPITSTGNGSAGVRLDDGGSAEINGSTLEGNSTADLHLTFGSRATLNGNNIDLITCDRTSLLRGDVRTFCLARPAQTP